MLAHNIVESAESITGYFRTTVPQGSTVNSKLGSFSSFLRYNKILQKRLSGI
jgi:hypothetical protein